jgi:hypothetical protein
MGRVRFHESDIIYDVIRHDRIVGTVDLGCSNELLYVVPMTWMNGVARNEVEVINVTDVECSPVTSN